MVGAEAYTVNIIGLSNKVHHFNYEIGDDFFRLFGTDLISSGSFNVDVSLNKHETFIEATFAIRGKALLVCDRSLEAFDEPLETTRMIVFKFGEEDREISDEIMLIQRDTTSLKLGQFIYEFIGLALPMKRLHPRFRNEDESESGGIVYSSDPDKPEDAGETDPRWEKLKKLK